MKVCSYLWEYVHIFFFKNKDSREKKGKRMLFMPSKCYQRDPAVLGCPPAAGGRKAVTLQMPGSVQGTGCAEMNATE